MEPIKFATPDVSDREIEQIKETVETRWLTSGPKVREFEKAIAKHKEVTVEKNIFDYRNFKEAMADFLKGQQIN